MLIENKDYLICSDSNIFLGTKFYNRKIKFLLAVLFINMRWVPCVKGLRVN